MPFIKEEEEGGWNRGPGGELSVARPPGRVTGAPQARKAKNNRVEWYPVNKQEKNK
jgi:hypothetical protein